MNDDTVSGHDLAKTFDKHSQVALTRASERRITIAHVADDPAAEAIPHSLFDYINDHISYTDFEWEYSDPSPSTVERHSLTGGVHHDAIAGNIGPDKVELQVHLVRV